MPDANAGHGLHHGFHAAESRVLGSADRNKEDVFRDQVHVGRLAFEHLLELDWDLDRVSLFVFSNDLGMIERRHSGRSTGERDRLHDRQRLSLVHDQSAGALHLAHDVDHTGFGNLHRVYLKIFHVVLSREFRVARQSYDDRVRRIFLVRDGDQPSRSWGHPSGR